MTYEWIIIIHSNMTAPIYGKHFHIDFLNSIHTAPIHTLIHSYFIFQVAYFDFIHFSHTTDEISVNKIINDTTIKTMLLLFVFLS